MKPMKTILAVLILALASAVHAAESTTETYAYEEGTHFVRLDVPVKTRDPNKIEVMEYFSYACPHCYQFEPLLQQWKSELPEDVVFKRTPAIWRVSGYELFARTYYTTAALGVLEQIHAPFFQAIHATPPTQRHSIDLPWVARFMSQQGVDPEEFVKTFQDSFGVKAQYQQATARQRIYRASGVPALIINGKYRIETGMVGGSRVAMLQVADFLIERERSLLAQQEAAAGE